MNDPDALTIEKVARAIAKASNEDPDELTGSLLHEGQRIWQQYTEQAVAAIAASRAPLTEK